MDINSPSTVFIFVWCLLGVLDPSSGEPVAVSCYDDQDACYYLYKESRTVSMSEAFQKCDALGQTLATIKEQRDQGVISKLDYVGTELAWVAAKISEKDYWQTLSGDNISDIEYEPGTNFRCSAYQPTDEEPLFFAVPCKIPEIPNNYLRWSVCQETAQQQDRCPDGSYQLGQLCYFVPPNATYTAFDGNTICSLYSHGSNLAYTGIMTKPFQTFVKGRLAAITTTSSNTIEVWTGVFRKPWVWMRGAMLTGDESQMVYTHWQPLYGTRDRGSCLSINLANTRGWQNMDCSKRLLWYICRGEKLTTAASKLDSTTVVVNVTGVSGSDIKTSTSSGTSRNTIIIVATVTTIMIIIIVIASIVICLRCSPTRKKGDEAAAGEMREYRYDGSQETTGSIKASEMTPSTVGDSTNRDLTPMDFNLVSETRSSKHNGHGGDFFWGQE
ncbi:hypothetical protein LSH36_326g05034 [Paralvinella palmiformis]|uniref:C-type lectin domain-containing protein n=1 Tax=Paralvinella palmiformis TaxID=53620 RepID=A0AAD9N347_9ANNE|nr:hypothetical protein LSH36_326g05034 [Paralvinella palmiformis]